MESKKNHHPSNCVLLIQLQKVIPLLFTLEATPI